MNDENIKKIKRSKEDKVIAGIFGGMGEYFKIDSVIFRLIGVILFFATSFVPFIIAYIIAIIIIPEEKTASNKPNKKQSRNKWILWLLIIILIIISITPLLALFGFRNYAKNLQKYSFMADPVEVTEEYYYVERETIEKETLPGPDRNSVNGYLEKNIIKAKQNGEIFAEYHELGRSTNKLFIWGYIAELYKTDNEIKTATAISLPLVIEFSENEFIGHQTPRDGSYYSKDIKDMFPKALHDNVLNFQSIHEKTINHLKDSVEKKAESNFE